MASLRKYCVRRGDTLVSLSEKWYGTEDLALFIYEHNTNHIDNPNNLLPGTVIAIPYHEAVVEVNLV